MMLAACGGQYGAEDGNPTPVPGVDAASPDGAPNGADGSSLVDAGSDQDAAGPGAAYAVLAAGLNDPGVIALDAQYVYYTSGATAEVRRCSRGGCNTSPELVAGSQGLPSGMTVAASTIYWTTGYRYIRKCATGATMPCTPSLFADTGTNSYPSQPFAFGTRLYWFTQNGATKSIFTCPLSGCSSGYPKSIYASTVGDNLHNQSTIGLAIDGTYLYLSRFLGGIVRFTMTGPESVNGATSVVLTSTGYSTSSLELDGTTLRWAVANEGKVNQCTTPTCTTVSPFLTMRGLPQSTISDAQYTFGVDKGMPDDAGNEPPNGGFLWRLAK